MIAPKPKLPNQHLVRLIHMAVARCAISQLPRKDHCNTNAVLAALAKDPTTTIFEITSTAPLARTITYLVEKGLVVSLQRQPYPRVKFRLTKDGKARLKRIAS